LWGGAAKMTKGERIKATLQATKERRKSQRPVTYILKIQNLTRQKEERLNRAFLEAKWFYNWLVSNLNRLSMPAHKITQVEVKVGDKFEPRELQVLGGQVKQEIANRIKDNLKGLRQLKERGHKVGALKPKPFVNFIPLVQYGNTHKIDFRHNKVKIVRLGEFRVLGLHQIPPNAEIASATLIRKPSGYYVHVTCYLPKEEGYPEPVAEAVGIDFGVKDKLTLSNGLRIDFEVPETLRLKRLQRLLARKLRGSKNREKVLRLLRREYERIANRRRDCQNKIIAFLKHYRVVVWQDDSIKGWAAQFGRQVHRSGIGGLKLRLSASLRTPILVERFVPTSQICAACGQKLSLTLSDRILRCNCGWVCDRDLNSALNILRFGLSLNQSVGLGRPELTPVEWQTAVRILGSNPHIRISRHDEAGSRRL
jgi:putative transposase